MNERVEENQRLYRAAVAHIGARLIARAKNSEVYALCQMAVSVFGVTHEAVADHADKWAREHIVNRER